MQKNKVYIGNLSYTTTEANLSEFFGAFGQVESAKIITDRDSGRSKGFGFIEFSSDEEADKAVKEANGKEIDGRAIRVNIAENKPKPSPRRW